MYEPLNIPGTHRLDGLYKSVGFTHWTPGRIILFRNASFPMKYLTIWPSRVQVELLQTIHTREISSLRLSFCKKTSGNKTRKLVYPPPLEKPDWCLSLCLSQQWPKISLITCISPLLCNIHWGEPERAPHGAVNAFTVCFIYVWYVRCSVNNLY